MPPLRDIAVTIIVVGSLPYCFLRPWVGVLVWSWLGYMNPHKMSWGFAASMPFAQMVAIATMAGLLVTKERYPLPKVREFYLLVLLWLIFLLSTIFAEYPTSAWQQMEKVSKILVMSFVTMALFQDRQKIKALLWVISLSIGYFGFKGGLWAFRTGAGDMVLGPEGTFIAGNTEIGMALNMVLRTLFVLRREETRPWLRHFLTAVFVLSIVATLITYSRGAFLALMVVISLLFLKSRAKVWAMVLLAIAVPVALTTLPEQWFGKMQTIETYEEDPSAMGRIGSWKLAIELSKERPILGFGFRPFTREIFQEYGMYSRRGRDAHSIFFQILAEHGYVGLSLYVGLILCSFLTLRRLIRASKTDPSLRWVSDYSEGLQASLAAFVVCGAFLSMSYFDLFYHLVAIVIILKKMVLVHHREVSKEAAYPVAKPSWAAMNPG